MMVGLPVPISSSIDSANDVCFLVVLRLRVDIVYFFFIGGGESSYFVFLAFSGGLSDFDLSESLFVSCFLTGVTFFDDSKIEL